MFEVFDVVGEFYNSTTNDSSAARNDDGINVWGFTTNIKFDDNKWGIHGHITGHDSAKPAESSRHINFAGPLGPRPNIAATYFTGGLGAIPAIDTYVRAGVYYNDADNGYKLGLFYNWAAVDGDAQKVAGAATVEDASWLQLSAAAQF